MAGISTQHPEYIAHLPVWELMRDALKGEREIKLRGVKYLPIPPVLRDNLTTETERTLVLYDAYKARGQFPEWAVETRRAMVGLASKLKPEIALPPRLEHMRDNATADGFTLNQLFLRALREVLVYGRVCLVVDVDHAGLPFIAVYNTFSAVNWQSSVVDGRHRLSLVVLREMRPTPNRDKYSHETVETYRELSLNESNHYEVVCYDKAGQEIDRPTAHRADGSELDEMPVVFCGSTDNSPAVDEVPLQSVVQHALKFYQVSADYYASLYYTSHPQPYTTDGGAGVTDPDGNNTGEVDFTVSGPSVVWSLPYGATCGYLEFTGSGIEANYKDMQTQRSAAAEAGSRVMDVGGQESGDARKARQNDQRATLSTAVTTVAESIEQVLRIAARWLGVDDKEVRFSVVPDFSDVEVDPQMLAQLFTLERGGILAKDAVHHFLQTGKLPERTYEDELTHMDNTQPGDLPE